MTTPLSRLSKKYLLSLLTWGRCCLLSETLYFTQDITALNTCSSERTFNSSLAIISTNWLTGSNRNSSDSMTSWKLCWVNLSAILRSSRHECVSANALIPKQFDGSSCLLRNSQHMSWISVSCNRHAAGSSIWTLDSSTIMWDV